MATGFQCVRECGGATTEQNHGAEGGEEEVRVRLLRSCAGVRACVSCEWVFSCVRVLMRARSCARTHLLRSGVHVCNVRRATTSKLYPAREGSAVASSPTYSTSDPPPLSPSPPSRSSTELPGPSSTTVTSPHPIMTVPELKQRTKYSNKPGLGNRLTGLLNPYRSLFYARVDPFPPGRRRGGRPGGVPDALVAAP